MADRLKVSTNFFFLMISEGFHAIVSLCVVAVLVRYFSIERFGDYAFILAFCNIFQVITDMGVNQIIIREISRKRELATKIFSASFFLRVVFSILTFALIILIINLVSSSSEIIRATYICGLGVVCFFFYNLMLAIFQGYERMEFVTIAEVISRGSYLVLILLVVLCGGGLQEIFLPSLVSSILGFLIGYLIVKRFFFLPSLNVDYSLCWYIIKESYLLGIGRILRKASFRMDIILLKFLKGSAEAGFFQGIYKPILQLMFIPRNLSSALFPVFSRRFGDGSDSLRDIYQKSLKMLTIMVLPAVIFIIFFSREFITLLLGKKFLVTVSAFNILGIVWSLMFISTILLRLLTAIDRQDLYPLCIGFALTINLVLDVIFIPQKGFFGAALATFFAEVGLIMVSFFFVSKHLIRVPLGKIIYGPLSAAFLMGAFCLWLINLSFIYKMLFVLPCGLFIYLIYIMLTKTFTMEEYQWLRYFIKNLKQKSNKGQSK